MGCSTSAALVERFNLGWFSGALTADPLRHAKNSHGLLVISNIRTPWQKCRLNFLSAFYPALLGNWATAVPRADKSPSWFSATSVNSTYFFASSLAYLPVTVL